MCVARLRPMSGLCGRTKTGGVFGAWRQSKNRVG